MTDNSKTNDSLQNFVAGMSTNRDKRSYSEYSPVRALNQQQLSAAYRSSWLAKRIINTVADDMTREWLDVTFDDNSPENRLIIERCEKRLRLRKKINDGLKWGRLYGGAIAIIGIRNEPLDRPLDASKVKKGQLQYLHVVDRWRVMPDGPLVADLASPHFARPEFYKMAQGGMRIHHSRVLVFDGQLLPHDEWERNGRWHDSELQHVMETLKDKDSISANIATMMFEANVDVIEVPDLAQAMASKEGASDLLERFQLAAMVKANNRMLIIGGGEKFTKQQNSFANLDKISEVFMMDICGAADIPATRLFGRAPGGMSSTGESDIRNYYDMISSKQEDMLLPQLEWLYEIIARSELGRMPDDMALEFRPLWQMSAKEEAEIGKLNAERDEIYINAGVITEGVAARTLKERGTYSGMTDEDVEMAEALAESADDPEQTDVPRDEEEAPQEVDPDAVPALPDPAEAV